MDKKSLPLAALLIVAFVILLWLVSMPHQTERQQRVTVFSRGNASLSAFRDWKDVAPGQSATINQSAFLFSEALFNAQVDGIMMASPRDTITQKEARVLSDYVRRGGRLILSAHDRATYAHFRFLWRALEINETVEDNSDFKNQHVIAVSPKYPSELFRPGRQYGFYSLIRFAGKPCAPNGLACFAREIPFGQGHVLLTLGLPLPGNAMMAQVDNADFTLALGKWAPRLMIDEYHHFYTQNTRGDLLARADVALPLGGMIVGLVLFFIFGHAPFHQRQLPTEISRTYHELNENVVRGFLQQRTNAGDAIDMQQRFLLRLFPDQQATIHDLHQRARRQIDRHPRDRKSVV